MPIASDDLRLFGLDLRNLWHDLRRPWAKLVGTPAWAWLAPRTVIQVAGVEQNGSIWAPDPNTRGFLRRATSAQDRTAAPFRAILLAEDLLLRKRLVMPLLDADQMKQALSLEALNSNPFANSGLVWGYALNPQESHQDADTVAVDMVMASRERVERFIASQMREDDPAQRLEVWALLPRLQDRAMPLMGFGEVLREQHAKRYWVRVGLLSLLGLGLGIAMGVTPFLQSRARVLQANAAYAVLDKQAAPQLAKRDSLLKVEDQVKALADIIGHRLDPLQLIQALTNALSDDTVLQRLQIEGRKVLIAGQASDSASLMQKLGAMPQIKDVRAPSAAVRQPGMAKESFQIEFQLVDDFGVSPSDAATAAALAPAGAASTPVIAPVPTPAPAATASTEAPSAPGAPVPAPVAAPNPVTPANPAPTVAPAVKPTAPPAPPAKGDPTETIGG